MGIGRFKLIDRVLGIIALTSIILALFYQPLLLEAVVLSLLWLGVDMYVSLKTSKLNFAMDILFIAAFVIASILAPNLFSVSTLASIMPNTAIPKKTLAKLVIVGGLLAIVALYAIDVIRMIREAEIVL
jgi:hypothetical protein